MILYTTPGCLRCYQVLLYLKEKKIHYTEVNLLSSPEAAKKMQEQLGEVYAPVLWHNGQFFDAETYFFNSPGKM